MHNLIARQRRVAAGDAPNSRPAPYMRFFRSCLNSPIPHLEFPIYAAAAWLFELTLVRYYLTNSKIFVIIIKKPFFKTAPSFKINLSISARNGKIFTQLILIRLQFTRDEQEKKKKELADFQKL